LPWNEENPWKKEDGVPESFRVDLVANMLMESFPKTRGKKATLA
jgi:hypothetical protein